MKSVIGGLVLATLVSPALAQEFRVQYSYVTHECSIVEQNSPESAQDGTPVNSTANPPADPAASGSPSNPPMGFAPPTQNTPPVIVRSGAQNDRDTPSNTAGTAAPANTTPVGPPGTPSNPATPGAASTPGAATSASNGGDQSDPFAPLKEAWARKKAAAEANGTANVQAIFVGTPMRSREEAESAMQIMRICGLAP